MFDVGVHQSTAEAEGVEEQWHQSSPDGMHLVCLAYESTLLYSRYHVVSVR